MNRALLWASMLSITAVGCVERTTTSEGEQPQDASVGAESDATPEPMLEADEGAAMMGGAGGGEPVEPGCLGSERLVAMPSGVLDFGLVMSGETSTRDITVSNPSERAVQISNILLNGSADFEPRVNGVDPRREPEVLFDPDNDGQPGISPGGAVMISVTYTPPTAGADVGELTIMSDCAEPVTVELAGEVPGEPFCGVYPDPSRVWAYPNEAIDLTPRIDGPAGELLYRWNIVEVPARVPIEIVDNFIDPAQPELGGPIDSVDTPSAWFSPAVAGLYTFDLVVLDAMTGEPPVLDPSCAEGRLGGEVLLDVRPPFGLTFELSWMPAVEGDDSSADGNLYVLHPRAPNWQRGLLRCGVNNTGPDWGEPGETQDDCRLLSDDAVGGAGTERAEIAWPESTDDLGGLYEVGVEFGGVFTETLATLKIYADGVLVYEAMQLMTPEMRRWHVASVGGSTGAWSIENRDRLYAEWPE
ncbi:MAG: hypothetical protein ACE366_00440 [Bradymonadia bacterium]